jgi:AcrR family transcriptional regulator
VRRSLKGKTTERPKKRAAPAGSIRIAEALEELLAEKEFSLITFDDIVRTSGVGAPLVYRYFGSKRGLLHHVLNENIDVYLEVLERDLKGIKGALNKLRKLIFTQLDLYESNRVLAKILLLEVRNHHSYFESEAYEKIRSYSRIIRDIIEDGVREGEIRKDIPARSIRQVIIGGFEHLALPSVISGKPFSAEDLTNDLCTIIFNGICTRG